ncbi:MAG: hypothetical protein J6T10_21655 [Methanobrevibacter sp.]|nr:hypothetical protein [Methanobrevibacter sp.]MBO7695237.1 hypothetical protein [Methanobrevibacter sp.]
MLYSELAVLNCNCKSYVLSAIIALILALEAHVPAYSFSTALVIVAISS